MTRICEECNCKIEDRWTVRVNDKFFHMNCFRESEDLESVHSDILDKKILVDKNGGIRREVLTKCNECECYVPSSMEYAIKLPEIGLKYFCSLEHMNIFLRRELF